LIQSKANNIKKPITLDGQVDLNISFGEKTLYTTVYIKLVAPDALLLSEGALGVVSYHPNVQAVHPVAVTHVCSGRDIVPPSTEQDTESHISAEMMTTMEAEEMLASSQKSSTPECVFNNELSTISRMNLIKTVCLPANFTAVVPIQVPNVKGSVMLEPLDSLDSSLQIAESLTEVRENGSSAMVSGKFTYQLQKGVELLLVS